MYSERALQKLTTDYGMPAVTPEKLSVLHEKGLDSLVIGVKDCQMLTGPLNFMTFLPDTHGLFCLSAALYDPWSDKGVRFILRHASEPRRSIKSTSLLLACQPECPDDFQIMAHFIQIMKERLNERSRQRQRHTPDVLDYLNITDPHQGAACYRELAEQSCTSLELLMMALHLDLHATKQDVRSTKPPIVSWRTSLPDEYLLPVLSQRTDRHARHTVGASPPPRPSQPTTVSSFSFIPSAFFRLDQ